MPTSSNLRQESSHAEAMQQLVERFEDAWQQGLTPVFEDYLPAGEPSLSVLASLAHVDLERRLKAGEAMRVETYLERFPILTVDPAQAVDLIVREYELRRRREPGLSHHEYLARFPHYEEILQKRLPAHDTIYDDNGVPLAEPARALPATRSGDLQETHPHQPGNEMEAKVDLRSFLAPPQSEQELGRLAQYRVLKELGHGGMGMVLLAEDSQLRRLAALKIMLPRYARDRQARERFLREARVAAKVKHDNVVTIYQVAEEHGVPFIAMEFLKGDPLDRYLKETSEIPIALALRIGREMAEGLQAAHAEGLIHRDIKPANVWLEAPRGRVKILDFGLAREERDATHLTQSGAVVGTPAFMSPEQANGEALDPRSDLFSLGIVLYRLSTGKQPFNGSTTMAVLKALSFDSPKRVRELNPNVPAALERVIHCLLEKEPGKRPQTAEEVALMLAAIEKPPSAGAPTPLPEIKYIIPHATAVLDPFADIDATPSAVEPNKPASARPAPAVDRPGGRKRPLLIGAALFGFALLAAVIIVIVRDKDGKEIARLQVPEGSKVEVVENGKTTVAVDPKPKKAPIAKVDPPPFVPPTFNEKEAKTQQDDWAAKLKLPVEATNKIGIKMILIPPAGPGAPGLPKAYYLGKYEVTQGEWEKVMGSSPSKFGPKNAKVAGMDTSKFPVENVNWFDSVEFCNKLSEQEGLKPYYDLKVTKRVGKDSMQIEEAQVKTMGGDGYHIPTDAEWKHGCAAGSKTKYHCGDKDEDLLEYAWFDKNSDGRTHAVGEKKPNGFGLYDMHGNVSEWNEEMLTNAATGAMGRVNRGGNHLNTAANCAASLRSPKDPVYRAGHFGLRVSRVPLNEVPVNANPGAPDLLRAPFTKEQAEKARAAWAAYLKVPERKQLDLPKGVKLDLVLIPPGQFRMGTVGTTGTEVAHPVTISNPFYMAVTETTQEQYEAVVGKNPSAFSAQGSKKEKIEPGMDTSKFPVERVSWLDAEVFAKEIPASLPTEAQWEYACRAGTITDFHFGNSLNGNQANCDGTKRMSGTKEVGPNLQRTTKVASYPANAFGLYDMHGNVYEWCRDWYAEKLVDLAEKDPERTAKQSDDRRVLRGGSWFSDVGTCRAACRSHIVAPGNLHNYDGFRVVLLLPSPRAKDKAAPKDADRRAIEMLNPHADVTVRLPDGQKIAIKKAEKIPDGPLVVTKVYAGYREVEKVDDFLNKLLLPAVLPLDELENLIVGIDHLPLDEKQMAQLAAAPFAPNLLNLDAAFELNPKTIDVLKKFPKLTDLTCRAKQADDADLARLKEMTGLKCLHLRGLGQSGRVTSRGYEALAATTLTHLFLIGTRLDAEGLRHLAVMPELICLNGAGTGLTDDLMIEVGKFPRLQLLNLDGNPAITDAGLAHLKGMKTLRGLYVRGTKVTEAGARKLSDSLPQCQIGLSGVKIGPKDKSVKPPPPDDKLGDPEAKSPK